MKYSIEQISWSSIFLSILVLVLFILVTLRLNVKSKKRNRGANNMIEYPWYYRQQSNPMVKRDLSMNPHLIQKETDDLGQASYAQMNKGQTNETVYEPVTHDNSFYSPFVGGCKKRL